MCRLSACTSSGLSQSRWGYIAPILDKIFQDPSVLLTKEHMGVYTAVHNIIGGTSDGSGLPGGELYKRLDQYLQQQLEAIWGRLNEKNGECLLQDYSQTWKQHQSFAARVRGMFSLLQRSWIKRCLDENKPGVLDIQSLFVYRWSTNLPTEIWDRLTNSLLALIRAYREHNKIPVSDATIRAVRHVERTNQTQATGSQEQLGSDFSLINQATLIRSVIEAICSLHHSDHADTSRQERFDSFRATMVDQTTAYYTAEVALKPGDGVMAYEGLSHRFLNRLIAEREYLPRQPDSTNIRAMTLQALQTAYFNESALKWHYKDLLEKHARETLSVHAAGLKHYDDIVHLLTHNLRDIDSVDRSRRSALHCAVHARNTPMVYSLLKHGVRADLRDKNGQTAGHVAVLLANYDALNAILSQPTVYSIEDNEGQTISALMRQTNVQALDRRWQAAMEIASIPEQIDALFCTSLNDDEIQGEFEPTITSYKSGIYVATQREHSLTRFLTDDAYYRQKTYIDAELTWIHLPANNVSSSY